MGVYLGREEHSRRVDDWDREPADQGAGMKRFEIRRYMRARYSSCVCTWLDLDSYSFPKRHTGLKNPVEELSLSGIMSPSNENILKTPFQVVVDGAELGSGGQKHYRFCSLRTWLCLPGA